MSLDKGAMGEKLELVLIDGNTGQVKKHLVVAEGVCINLCEENINKQIEQILLERKLRLMRKSLERIKWIQTQQF